MGNLIFSNRELKKKEIELKWIHPILEELNYPTDSSIFYEKPDFVLPSNKDKRIGIEFTLCTDNASQNNIKAFNEILDEYALHYDAKREQGDDKTYKHFCEIRIWLCNGGFPDIEKCKRDKQRIFQEIDRYIFPDQFNIDNQYIGYAEVRENPRLPKSEAFVVYVAPYVDYEQINNVIDNKEKKLLDYKANKENRSIEEYWLIIGFPNHVPVELSRYEFRYSGYSSFNRIYLINNYEHCQFK